MGLSEKVYCITKQQETEINQNEMKNDSKDTQRKWNELQKDHKKKQKLKETQATE